MRIYTLLVLAPLALAPLAFAGGCGGKKAPVEPTVPTEVSEAGTDMASLDSGSMASSDSGSSMDTGTGTSTMTDTAMDAGAPVKDAGGTADAGKKPKPKPGGKAPKKP